MHNKKIKAICWIIIFGILYMAIGKNGKNSLGFQMIIVNSDNMTVEITEMDSNERHSVTFQDIFGNEKGSANVIHWKIPKGEKEYKLSFLKNGKIYGNTYVCSVERKELGQGVYHQYPDGKSSGRKAFEEIDGKCFFLDFNGINYIFEKSDFQRFMEIVQ